MDASRPGRPVNTASCPDQLPRGPTKKSFLKVHPASGAELTPLTRLARFKEVRDRNLAKASLSKNVKRTSLIARHSIAPTMLNGGAAPSNENGVTHTNGNGEPAGNHPKALSPVKDLNGVEGLVHKSSEPSTEPASPRKATPSPKKPVQAKQNGASGPSAASEPHREIVEAPQPKNAEVTVRTEEEHAVIDGESEGEADNGHESSGSSLDVVIDDSSSAGSAAGLDLHVSIGDDFVSPDQTLDNVPVIPGPSHRESTPKDEEPYMPDIIKRLKSGGQISSRPTLGDRRKRGADQDSSSGSGHKRHRSDSSPSLPTSWQFFSPPSALMRVWNRQGEANARHVDDSMVVNVSTVDPPKQEKWCSIM